MLQHEEMSDQQPPSFNDGSSQRREENPSASGAQAIFHTRFAA